MVYKQHHCPLGVIILLCSLFALSIFVGINFNNRLQMYTAGMVAGSDVVAGRDLLVEDVHATKARREALRLSQPLVFDLNLSAFEDFSTKLLDILNEINGLSVNKEYTALSDLDAALTTEIAEIVLVELTRTQVQEYILKTLLPRVRGLLNAGLVSDMRAARVGENGVIIRTLETEVEMLRKDLTILPDVQSTLVELSSEIRQSMTLDEKAKRALILLLSAFMPSSLSLNTNETYKRAEIIANAKMEPVYYTIHRGEIVVRKGAVVTEEQQAKLQAMYSSVGSWIQIRLSLGLFILSTIISCGLFMAPSGKPGSSLKMKDYCFMSLLVVGCGLLAKLVYILGVEKGDMNNLTLLAYGFPVAGFVGIVAMVFAARRYCTISLLLALFTTVIFKGSVELFFYYFLGGMLITLLVTRAQTRQDMVWSIIPLTCIQLLFWLATTLLIKNPFVLYPAQLLSVVVNSIVSILLLFAFSPFLEMIFSYTTRFKLMECMNLEQPLMQELMVKMPGTYHHSLVVSNMAEAGAKVIGANSLLCKVGALYHDVGKLSHPDYFIENQFGGRNKHDKINPSMSALILTSHVKKGAELAATYKLGEEISDLIAQHHGTRLISYFYHKAQTMNLNVRESDFCYAGPRPQTKESAILMLADSVEASSRTLTDPTPARLKAHIDKIVKGIYAEGQLDESALTFKDINKISEQFLRILAGIFHQRIVYPAGNPKDPTADKKEQDDKKVEGASKGKIVSMPAYGISSDSARQDIQMQKRQS